jgi:hypothetical protein
MVPLTRELAKAAQRRGRAFTSRMPIIEGLFDDGDDGDDAGRVVILGVGAAPETVKTAIPGTGHTFEVPCNAVTLAPDVAEHLEIALSYVQKSEWMERNPRQGRRSRVCNPALH